MPFHQEHDHANVSHDQAFDKIDKIVRALVNAVCWFCWEASIGGDVNNENWDLSKLLQIGC